MANLCVACCHSVNGVSALHSEILKDSVFHDFYTAHARQVLQRHKRHRPPPLALPGKPAPDLDCSATSSAASSYTNAECLLGSLQTIKITPPCSRQIAEDKDANKADFAKRVKANDRHRRSTRTPFSMFRSSVCTSISASTSTRSTSSRNISR